MQPLPVKAEREAEREAGEKALRALVSLGWLWLQDTHQDGQKKKKKTREGLERREEALVAAEVHKMEF